MAKQPNDSEPGAGSRRSPADNGALKVERANALQAAQAPARQAEFHALLLRLSNEFIGADASEIDQAIQRALGTLGRYVEASSCYLFEFDSAMASSSKRFEWRSQTAVPTIDAFTGVTPESMPTLFPRAAAGEVLRVNDLDELGPEAAAERAMLESLDIGAFICLPVRTQGRVVGLLGFDQRGGGRRWNEDEELVLRLSTEMFAQAIDRRRAYNQLEFHIGNAPLAVMEWDAEWRIKRWSPKAEELFGWRRDEVLGRSWGEFRFVHEDDAEHVARIAEELLNGSEGANTSINRNYAKDGRVTTCEWFNSVLRDESGGLISILSFAQDITQRQRDQRALTESQTELETLNAQLEQRVEQRTAELRDSERRYRTLAEHATDMISLHDENGRFTYLSPACRRLLGYDPEELVGELPRVIAHEEDRDAVIQSLARLRQTTDVVSTTFRARRKDGSTIWLESSSRNEGHEIVVVSRDVSPRLETEHRLRLIRSAVEQVGDSVTITDNHLDRPGPHIVYVNPAFTEMTGYTPEEAIGLSPRILQGPKTNQNTLRRLRQSLHEGRPFSGETVNYRKNGSAYDIEWHINPLRDSRGHITHWVAIQRDMTERNVAADLARVHREELAHVTRLSTMGEMASGLAHEINQPLAAINNYASGALRRIEHQHAAIEDLAQALSHISDQSERAGQIIRRLRAFVMKRGTLRSTQHINDLINETLALLEADIAQHDSRVELDLAPDEDLSPIHVDGIQIEQVLVNLVRNALEAMLANAAEDRVLKITTRRSSTGNLHITLADRGPGLTASQRDHLFDPFFTTKDDGMGMGLTISQSIIQAHNGRLWVSNASKGHGAEFNLTLPTTPPLPPATA